MTQWPKKDERERLEIKGFIGAYAQLPTARRLEVVTKTEMPDYVVRDIATGQEYGVELTSVYMDDRSVPDLHMREEDRPVHMPDDRPELEWYLNRLAEVVAVKIDKARKRYSQDRPLILSIYVNEYISMYLDVAELQRFVKRHDALLEGITPFQEVVFWNLPNGGVLCARPSRTNVEPLEGQ